MKASDVIKQMDEIEKDGDIRNFQSRWKKLYRLLKQAEARDEEREGELDDELLNYPPAGMDEYGSLE